jgi:hypothetical protein
MPNLNGKNPNTIFNGKSVKLVGKNREQQNTLKIINRVAGSSVPNIDV